jgi:snoRNA binding domain, fibrillarin
VQAISLLDALDKAVNTFIMRVREWYSWHFPELGKIVTDHFQYARVVMLIKNKFSVNDEMQPDLEAIVEDADVATQVSSRVLIMSASTVTSRHTQCRHRVPVAVGPVCRSLCHKGACLGVQVLGAGASAQHGGGRCDPPVSNLRDTIYCRLWQRQRQAWAKISPRWTWQTLSCSQPGSCR